MRDVVRTLKVLGVSPDGSVIFAAGHGNYQTPEETSNVAMVDPQTLDVQRIFRHPRIDGFEASTTAIQIGCPCRSAMPPRFQEALYLLPVFLFAQYAFNFVDRAFLAAADIFRRRRLGVVAVGCFPPTMLAAR